MSADGSTGLGAVAIVVDHGLREDYAATGFGGHLAAGLRPALVVIDVQRAYTDPTAPLYAAAEDALHATVQLLRAARTKGIPIVFTYVAYSQSKAEDAGVWARKLPFLANLADGSWLVELDERLERRPEELLLRKPYASAFFGTALASYLSAQRIDTVLLTGYTTSGCVRASAVDALQHGFVPLVVREAVGDRHRAPHEANLFDLQAKYAEVLSLADALAVVGPGRPA